jgi:hypothetical protein
MNRTSLIVGVLIGLMCCASEAGAPAPVENNECGAASDGLQMCLAAADSNLQLTLRNVGDHQLTLNLGIMLANGTVQLPNRVAIKFTDALGKTRVFKFSDLRYGFVAGRVDDYVVQLRVRSSYTLHFTLNQFWCHETKEFSIPLLSGENHLTAQLEGAGATHLNTGQEGMALMNFWLGKVDSNTLTLRR